MLTVGALALSVGACGKKNGSAASDEEIVYTSSWGADEPQGKLIRSIADDFTKATGTKVDLKFVGRKGTDTLPTEMTAGQGPDLFDTSTDSVGAFVAQKLAAPLDDVLDMEVPGEGRKVRDVLPESVQKASTDDGHVRFMAHTVISTAVWYDASKHAGLAPRTWDEFIDYLDKAKKDGRTPLGQDGTVNFYNAYWFYSALVRSEGAGSLSALGKDPAAWDGPAVLAAAEKVEQLADGGYFQKDFMATKYPAAQDAWAQGKYDLNLNGTWLAAETGAKLAKGTEVASFQLPAGGKNSVEVGTLGWGVNAKGHNIEAAKKFLAFALQKKYEAKISDTAHNIPARPDVPAPGYLAGVQKDVAEAKYTHRTYDDMAADKNWWNNVFLPLDDELLSGKIDAATFVKTGKKKAADYLASKG
ncbi:ABC transporter substrate-binding protein [Streptomyces sp. NBC_01435]|uniref:ABC transporter substrate-binding protein n=1 Tax=Streptomyces sp. NBC_01435 TaxID=2903865 RepID=UPI002E30CF3F|nr:extracellular solute-binding protein [Streptomyces sp. NBC_01435]